MARELPRGNKSEEIQRSPCLEKKKVKNKRKDKGKKGKKGRKVERISSCMLQKVLKIMSRFWLDEEANDKNDKRRVKRIDAVRCSDQLKKKNVLDIYDEECSSLFR